MASSRGFRRPGLVKAVAMAMLMATALLLAWAAWRWYTPAVRVQTLQTHDMVHSVVATATVQTQHRASTGVQIAGKVRVVNVMEGDRFRQGQTLLTLDDAETQSALAVAQLSARQARVKLREWREVEAPTAAANDQLAQANVRQASAQLERQQALFNQGFIGQAALDEATRASQVALAQARSAKLQSLANADSGLTQELLSSALVFALANADGAKARLSYTALVAPFNGMVVSRNVEPGDAVQPGKTLLLLAPQGDTELVAQIDERNLAVLRIGQPATASADAFAQQRFAAWVSRIAPGVDAQRGSVQVKLTVAHPPDYLRQDMTVSVEIEVARQAAALAVPLEAVHAIESVQPWVWRLSAASALERVPVTVGLRSGAWVELRAGVKPGERVLSAAGQDLHAGQHVRVTAP